MSSHTTCYTWNHGYYYWGIFLFLLVILPAGCNAACQDVQDAFTNRTVPVKENIPVNHIFFNTTQPSSVVLSLRETSGPGYLALVEKQVGSEKQFILLLNRSLDTESPGGNLLAGNIRCKYASSPNFDISYTINVEDVNEFAPVFKNAPFSVSISEFTRNGTSIFDLNKRARDPDSSPNFIVYSLMGNDLFGLSNNGLEVITRGPLDYDKGPKSYVLNLTAKEHTGNPATSLSNTTTLTINILDENDLSPRFDHQIYNLTIDEGTYNNQLYNTVPPVTAQDQDTGISSTVQYSLDNSNLLAYRNLFSLLSNGSLSINGNLTPFVYTLTIRAYEVNRPSERFDRALLLLTVLDINDHSPVMGQPSYTGTVKENTPGGVDVLNVSASDGDSGENSAFVFHLVEPSDVFHVESFGETGWIRVNPGANIDRENKSEYILHVYAKEEFTVDHKTSLNSTVTISVMDVNDNSPVFTSDRYIFNINKTAKVGLVVGAVSATDKDKGVNKDITFSIQQLSKALFSLDSTSRNITVNQTLGDANVGEVYILVKAQDAAVENRRESLVLVTVNISDVNTGPPEFTNCNQTCSIQVFENLEQDSLIRTFSARDPDAADNNRLKFRIVGITNNTFNIMAESGILKLNSSLDREMIPSYNFEVEVSDGQMSSTATVSVIVLDTNDNNPIFNQSSYSYNVTEEQEISTVVVGTVQATDRDAGVNGQLKYSLSWPESPATQLEINSTTGEITTTKLDRENQSSYDFSVVAVDGGSPPRSSVVGVHIRVIDVNDHGPVFDKPFIKLKLAEASQPRSFYTAQASDEDIGQNKVIVYEKASGDFLFVVNSKTGAISATQNLTLMPYNVTIMAYNKEPYVGNCRACKNTSFTVIIQVTDVNNQAPKFNQSLYKRSIPEGAVNNPVLKVTATDNDTDSSFKTVLYSISTGNDKGMFYIDQTLGNLYLLKSPDHDPPENDRNFNMTVRAEDGSQSDTADVIVRVTDENDNPPVFDQALYECSVEENSSAKTRFGCQVNATDIDSLENGNFTYSFFPTSSALPFQLDPVTGELSVSGAIDYEKNTTYRTIVHATDQGKPSKTGTCTVDIQVKNVNDNPPYFKNVTYSFLVLETVQVGALVGQVEAGDPDGTSSLTFSLMNNQDEFQVSSSGVITTAKILKCHKNFNLNVTVSDGSHTASVTVNVTVEAVNEYSPQFTKTSFSGQLQENATQGLSVVQVNATDRDCGTYGSVQYSLAAGNTQNVFRVENVTGKIILSCSGCLDANNKSLFSLFVKAEDGGQPPRLDYTIVTINIIDINNKPPQFQQSLYTASVFENVAVGTTIFQILAGDSDTPESELKYSIDNVNIPLVLKNRNIVVTNQTLDADVGPGFITSEVSVSDGTHRAAARINVTILDVNDNNPELEVKNISVPENAKIGSIVLDVNATDDDRTNRGFTFWLTNTEGKFEINSKNGELVVSGYFDRRLKKQYNVSVHVSDHGIPPRFAMDKIMIDVTDSNQAPKFNETQYEFHVFENASVDSLVGVVTAYDPDRGSSGTFSFSFLSENKDDTFSLDAQSGNITLKKPLDYEKDNLYTLKVEVNDQSYIPKSSDVTVTVKVIDVPEAPVWPLPLPVLYIVKADTCASSVSAFPQDITSVTNNNISVAYYLLNHTDVFTLNNSTGLLKVINSGTLQSRRYALGLQACNNAYPDLCSTAVLTVDVSDSSTLFFCPAFLIEDVKENASKGKVVVDLNTTSGDENVVYTIRNDSDTSQDQPFGIVPSNGSLFVSGNLDREVKDRYTLIIIAERNNKTTQAQVIIRVLDVSDTPPEFLKQKYEGKISENAAVGTRVSKSDGSGFLEVTATDKDLNTKLIYGIPQDMDESNGSISVDNTTGTIYLNRKVDRESMPAGLHGIYSLLVTVTDAIYTANATVEVLIIDENDNSPKFEKSTVNITVPENKTAGSVIFNAAAFDRDGIDEGKIQYSIEGSGPFKIDPSLGNVTLKEKLDRENKSSYSVVVVAKDMAGHNDTMVLNIEVKDINDNKPTFTSEVYSFPVVEGDAGVNSTLNVTAIDGDSGSNGALNYSIVGGNKNNTFGIKTIGNKGEITLLKELDREETGLELKDGKTVINLVVQVQDSGKPPLLSNCTVEVQILDVNDNTPKFNNNNYSAEVVEDAGNGTSITLVTASDPDSGDNGTSGIEYSLEKTPDAPFTVNPKTGEVTLFFTNSLKKLDRESVAVYDMKIVARDQKGSGRNSSASLTISVLDVNDEAPTFTEAQYNFSISENAPSDTEVGLVKAYDTDIGGNASITYSIVSGRDFRFYLDRQSGNITVVCCLDYQHMHQYNMNVSAEDGINVGYTHVIINVEDANDNCPVFTVTQPVYNISENMNASGIVNLTANDKDVGANGEVSFFMNNTDIQKYFNLSLTGYLSTKLPLDRENQSSFTFPVFARDHGNPSCASRATVTVNVLDVNDNDPKFCPGNAGNNKEIHVNILERSPIGSVVALPQVKDADTGENKRVTFSLEGGAKDYFRIENDTGLVSIAKTFDINELVSRNYSTGSSFNLTIVATDNGTPQRSSNITLFIQLQANSGGWPQFQENVYNFIVQENKTAGQEVGEVTAFVVNATGGIQTLTYSILEAGEARQKFNINGKTGNITTSTVLDRETRQRYSFIVQVKYGLGSERIAYAVVMVNVSDVNDNRPIFSPAAYFISIEENKAKEIILNVTASDRDLFKNQRITYSLVNNNYGVFSVNPDTGAIEMNGTLDRESNSSYMLTVQATDHGNEQLSSTAKVSITVTDVNDNSPVFQREPYAVTVPENKQALPFILKVTAKDDDDGLNGKVVYSLQGPYQNIFQINTLDGTVSSLVHLDHAVKKCYNLTVMAHDLGNPALNSTTQIIITVRDINDTQPEFVIKLYQTTVAVGTLIGTPIFTNLTAGEGDFYYNITGGDPEGKFHINSTTGIITVAKEITKQEFLALEIRASDRIFRTKFDTAQVFVTVVKAKVTFPTQKYTPHIPENLSPPRMILDLNTTAETEGEPVTYEIVNGQTDFFSLNKSNGKLSLIKSLDREEKSEYSIIVKVSVDLLTGQSSRSKRAVLSNEAEVVLTVDDENDNRPKIQTSRLFGIPERSGIGTVVATLKVSDLDTGNNSVIRFKTVDGDTSAFGINPTTGGIMSLVLMEETNKIEFKVTVQATDNYGKGNSDTAHLKIIVIADNERFGLVANMPQTEFIARKDALMGNLSEILGLNVQLESVGIHILSSDGEQKKADFLRSDAYFHAFNPKTNKTVSWNDIKSKIEQKQDDIKRLFGASTLLAVKSERVPTRSSYQISEAEIAIITIAGIMFLASLFAIIAMVRIWKKHKEFQKKQELAKKVREGQKKIAEDKAADEGFNETNIDSDNAEPLELNGIPLQRRRSHTSLEDQERVMRFGNESSDFDTILLKKIITKKVDLQNLEFPDANGGSVDSGIDQTRQDTGPEEARYDMTDIHEQDVAGTSSQQTEVKRVGFVDEPVTIIHENQLYEPITCQEGTGDNPPSDGGDISVEIREDASNVNIPKEMVRVFVPDYTSETPENSPDTTPYEESVTWL